MNAPAPRTVTNPSLQAAPPRPLVAALDLAELQRLRTLMAVVLRRRVSVSRLCVDRLYAFELLAEAHASDHAPLRELALALFGAYERAREPQGRRLSG